MRCIRPCSIGEFIHECSGQLRKSARQAQTGCSISYRADFKGEVSAIVYSSLSSVEEAAFLTFGCESSSLDPKGGHQFVAHPRVAKGQDGNSSSQRNEGRQDSYTKEANISETKDKRQRITLRQRRLLCRRLKSVSSRTGIGLLPEMQAAKSRSCATGQG